MSVICLLVEVLINFEILIIIKIVIPEAIKLKNISFSGFNLSLSKRIHEVKKNPTKEIAYAK